jgi:hypothetical protein
MRNVAVGKIMKQKQNCRKKKKRPEEKQSSNHQYGVKSTSTIMLCITAIIPVLGKRPVMGRLQPTGSSRDVHRFIGHERSLRKSQVPFLCFISQQLSYCW